MKTSTLLLLAGAALLLLRPRRVPVLPGTPLTSKDGALSMTKGLPLMPVDSLEFSKEWEESDEGKKLLKFVREATI